MTRSNVKSILCLSCAANMLRRHSTGHPAQAQAAVLTIPHLCFVVTAITGMYGTEVFHLPNTESTPSASVPNTDLKHIQASKQ